MVRLWSPTMSRLPGRGRGCKREDSIISASEGRTGAGSNCSRLVLPTPCSVPECRERGLQHTLSSEKLSGSQPAGAQGQAITMTVSNNKNLGGPKEVSAGGKGS